MIKVFGLVIFFTYILLFSQENMANVDIVKIAPSEQCIIGDTTENADVDFDDIINSYQQITFADKHNVLFTLPLATTEIVLFQYHAIRAPPSFSY